MKLKPYYFFLFMAIVFISACSVKNSGMKKVDDFWSNLTRAANAEAETAIVKDFHNHLRSANISFEIFFTKPDGSLASLQDTTQTGNDNLPITMKFYAKGNEEPVIKNGWLPKDLNNAYYFYHE